MSSSGPLTFVQSSLAFNIILTVSATGLFTSYIVCITCMLIKKIKGEQLPASKFRLGRRFGISINVMALIYLSISFVFLFFPAEPKPSAKSMNWGILLYGAAVLFAIGYYFAKGKYEYEGPVKYVKWQTQHDMQSQRDLET